MGHSDYSLDLWDDLKSKTKLWKGLDRYEDLCHKVNWDDGPTGVFFHKLCKMQLTSKRKLDQAISRQQKEIHESPLEVPSLAANSPDSCSFTSTKRLSHIGINCVFYNRKTHGAHSNPTQFIWKTSYYETGNYGVLVLFCAHCFRLNWAKQTPGIMRRN